MNERSTAPRRVRNWLVPAAVVVGFATFASPAFGGSDPIAGSQGTDTSLPPTPSQVEVTGRGSFAGLTVTVNQTKNLTDQAVSVTWSGGAPTKAGPGRFAANFMQIMQCWGDDDGTVPENPGPPPEQCVAGAATGTYANTGAVVPNGASSTRVISQASWANFDPAVGYLETSTSAVWRSFKAVDGTVVNAQVDSNFVPGKVGGNYWLNPYFNIITSNEIVGALTGPNGKGAELFQVQTGVQSSGLGCGQRAQKLPDGSKKLPQCWIVLVPRSTPIEENAGTPYEVRADNYGVWTSPLSAAAWQHRIAIPIDFNPVDSPCRLADVERRIAGNELVAGAIASWQPTLCSGAALPPFSYAPVGDDTARQILANPAAGAPGMVAVSRPLDPANLDPANPVVYAPLTASGIAIGLNLERIPRINAPADAQEIAGVRVADVNLTPRLVAKLLTQSYKSQTEILQPPGYDWVKTNPTHLGVDPDFLQFNPEFNQLDVYNQRTFGGLQLPSGTSDAAEQLWKWVLDDPEAAAWLAGKADPWGMAVNPVYSTNPSLNPTGAAFGTPAPKLFPKADPFCYQPATQGSFAPPSLCGTDWMPYARNFEEAAVRTRTAYDGARIIENPSSPNASLYWSRTAPQYITNRAMLSVTTTASARLYGVQMARLSRSGDDGTDREFVAPDSAGLAAGLASMSPGAEPQVLEPTGSSTTKGAYPLTTLTYAAIAPLALDSQARSEYAAFLDYAAGPGQVAGAELGQLPVGYLPLPAELKQQAAAAATTVRTLTAPPPPSTTVPPTSPPASNPAESTGSGSTGSGSTGSGTAQRTTRKAAALVVVPAADAPVGSDAPTTTSTPAAVDDKPAAAPVDKSSKLITPILSLGRSRYAVPGLAIVALGSLLGALEITKRPRRNGGAHAAQAEPVPEA
jgi:hypothetical protein